MATEIELKLEYSGTGPDLAYAELTTLTSLAGLTAGEPSWREITDIYWDTPDRRLQRLGAALRVRCCDSSWNICLKYGDRAQSGVFTRYEFEASLSERGLLDIWRALADLDDAPPPRAIPSLLTQPRPSGDLCPLLVAHSRRIYRPLLKSGVCLATMTVDKVRYDGLPEEFFDLEVELAPGTDPQLLQPIERDLRGLPGCEWHRASDSKLARGLRLLAASMP